MGDEYGGMGLCIVEGDLGRYICPAERAFGEQNR